MISIIDQRSSWLHSWGEFLAADVGVGLHISFSNSHAWLRKTLTPQM